MPFERQSLKPDGMFDFCEFVCNHVQFSVRWRFKLFGIWAALFVDGEICVCCVSLVGCSRQGDPRCLESGQDLLDTEGERSRGDYYLISLSSS